MAFRRKSSPTADMGQALSFGQLGLAPLELLLDQLAILNIDRYSVPLKEISLLVEKGAMRIRNQRLLPVSPLQAHFIFVRFAVCALSRATFP